MSSHRSVLQKIKTEVEQATWKHLKAKDATTALGHYTEDATVVSNGRLYRSFGSFAAQIETFYNSLREVHLANWDEMHIDVLSAEAAMVTAKFRWSSTDTADVKTDLQGVWTALFVHDYDQWKIRMRHESFFESER